MTDFRIVLSNITNAQQASDLATQIRNEYGDDFDAALGDFTVEVNDDGATVSLTVKAVGTGDIDQLADRLTDTGHDVQMYQLVGGNAFARDPDDDLIEG